MITLVPNYFYNRLTYTFEDAPVSESPYFITDDYGNSVDDSTLLAWAHYHYVLETYSEVFWRYHGT